MATTYSTLYHTQTSFNHKNNDDIFLHKCFTTKEDARHTRRFSVDSLYCNKRRKCSEPAFNPHISSTPRTRKTSSILRDIIVESISESMEIEQKCLENNNNNVPNGVDDHSVGNETKAKSPKKIYKHRKHHSDFGVVFQASDNKDDIINNMSRTASFSEEEEFDETDGADNLKVNAERKTYHRHSGSGLDLLMNHDMTAPGRIRKASSHMDITTTQMYKDIYADSLRQYGFIVAKQLGLAQRSPDQLRKTYVKSRQKALERRDRTNSSLTDGIQHERRDSLSLTRDRSSTASSIASVDSTASESSRRLSNASLDLRGNKYTKSLTDISNVSMLEKHRKPTTTVIRRKKGNKLPSDPTKRLSAPIMNRADMTDIDTIPVSLLRKQIASMSVPDLSRSSSPTIIETTPEETTTELTPPKPNHHPRKLSDETSQRHKDAKARNEWRMSRLKSFEGVLSQASSWIKDVKTKHRSGKQNIENEDQET